MPTFTRDSTYAEVIEAYGSHAAGKTFVITGPSQGSLAAEASFAFASANPPPSKIILLGRTQAKVQPVLDKIKTINASVEAAFVAVDLTDLQTVRRAAAEVQQQAPKIDVLINSAGIMAVEKFQKSADGFELQLAASHIGHFLLTSLLLPQLEASGDARVITLTSMGYEVADVRYDDWNFSDGKEYERWLSYGQAKTANVVFTRELAKRTKAQSKPITALVLHPGMILSTGIMQHTDNDTITKAFEASVAKAQAEGIEFVPEQQKTVEQGCATMVLAALQPELKAQSGAFLKDCNIFPEAEQKPYVLDEAKAAKLWALSEGWTNNKAL